MWTLFQNITLFATSFSYPVSNIVSATWLLTFSSSVFHFILFQVCSFNIFSFMFLFFYIVAPLKWDTLIPVCQMGELQLWSSRTALLQCISFFVEKMTRAILWYSDAVETTKQERSGKQISDFFPKQCFAALWTPAFYLQLDHIFRFYVSMQRSSPSMIGNQRMS